jgi:hypothetical protein
MTDCHGEFLKHKEDIETRFQAHKSEVGQILDKHHGENRIRLQSIDKQCIDTGSRVAEMNVKISRLYGEDGQPGAVDRLATEVTRLGNKMMYGSGFIAAVLILVGWYVEHSR